MTEITRRDGEAMLAAERQRRRHRTDQGIPSAKRAGELPDPAAVLVFARVDGGRWRLYASRSIPSAAFDVRSADEHRMTDPAWVVDAVMKDMLVITEDTQELCLMKVIQLWRNRDQAAALEKASADRKEISS